jgi:hypothetical protein
MTMDSAEDTVFRFDGPDGSTEHETFVEARELFRAAVAAGQEAQVWEIGRTVSWAMCLCTFKMER